MESGRQVDVKTCEFHLLQIAVKRTFDGDWMVGVAADKVSRHISYKPHQVLLP